MPSEKDRLYVALYARGGMPKMPGLEDTYHWALVVGPKKESRNNIGSVFNAKERLTIAGDPPALRSVWEYEERDAAAGTTSMLLVRVLVAKVRDVRRLRDIFEATPLRPDTHGWNCVAWVREALVAAMDDGRALGTCARDWKSVRNTAMWYIRVKKAVHRFDGSVSFDPDKVATWNMLERSEIEP
ncbi:hypothetical protein G6O67_003290 [Ophiocordyceps sinensis]|uniref:Uncharacterized protein n=2 Tax=Ophiocordyceps sinensis TaxID=72228 RepID=A0A8H4PW61_9HYPO|nr:hypothetical protein OCS_01429 [Ophiocordyceps sinensis CO18]KAF4511500.1 hypothetical protein G6O67_003290 [Ophiocordyceps sinensis]